MSTVERLGEALGDVGDFRDRYVEASAILLALGMVWLLLASGKP